MSLKLYRNIGSDELVELSDITLKDLLKSDNYMIHLRLDDEGDGLYDAILRADSLQDENCVLIPLVCSSGFKSTLDAFKTATSGESSHHPRIEFCYVNSDSSLDYVNYSIEDGMKIVPTPFSFGRSLGHVSEHYILQGSYAGFVDELRLIGYDVSEIDIPVSGSSSSASMRDDLRSKLMQMNRDE